jgi:hypothetical protein
VSLSYYDNVGVLGEGGGFEGEPFGKCEAINIE